MAKKKKEVSRKPSKKALREGRAVPKAKFPAHLRVDTPEEWRALKRQEWREVNQALQRYYVGSAYTPAASSFHKLGELAIQVTEAIEADGWIAW